MDIPFSKLDEAVQILFCDIPSHICSIGIYVRAGTLNESHKILGASHFLEHLAFKDTHNHDAESLNEAFDRLGARHNAYTTIDHTAYFAQVHDQNSLATLSLLLDMLCPKFSDVQFENERDVIIEEIQMYDDQPESFLSDTLQSLGFQIPDFSILGNRKTISDLTVSQLINYYKQAYTPDNIIIAISGNVDKTNCAKLINEKIQYLRSVQEAINCEDTTYFSPEIEFKSTSEPKRIKRDNTHLSYMQAMMPAPYSSSQYRHSARIWSELFSGENSILYKKLVDTGIADEVSTYYYSGADLGYFQFYCNTEVKDDQAAGIWQYEFERMCNPERFQAYLSMADIERVKTRLITSYQQQLETAAGRMRWLAEAWVEQRPEEYRHEENELKSIKFNDLTTFIANSNSDNLQTATLNP